MKSQMLVREAREIVRRLQENGYAGYLVGGYVRDTLLDRKIKDIDIATSALPEQVMDIFPRTVPTGLKHGTVTVVMQNHMFEVTTFRKESGYRDRRRPDRIEFIADLQEDLERRDFTMNAMAMDADGHLIDPFGGQSDLRDGVLRCVGDAERRFDEDSLRMMRCIRFAAEYELRIEQQTWKALLANRRKLKHIAMERIRSELERMLEGAHPYQAVLLLSQSGLLSCTKAETGIQFQGIKQVHQREKLLSSIAKLEDACEKWALLLLAFGISSASASSALRRLTFSRKKQDAICRILSFHEWLIGELESLNDSGHETALPEELAVIWKKGAVVHTPDIVRRWLSIYSLLTAEAAAVDTVKPVISVLVERLVQNGQASLNEMQAATLKELAIGGGDLLVLGGKPGPWVGKLLGQLQVEVVFGHLHNDKMELLQRSQQLIEEMIRDE